MNASENILQLIANANEDDLRDIVSGWADNHADFKEYVRNSLCPPVENVDFGRKLSQAVNRETKEFFSRYEVREATDWRNIYYDLIKPWSADADTLSTKKLYDLCDVIVKEVGMQVTEEDFYGDDWYGDDFSGSIRDIMDVLGNVAGLLMIREDVGHDILDSLEKLIKAANKNDVIDNYIGSPYGFILELINLRRNAHEVTREIYDAMIDEYPGDETGMWVCRKIDFLRSMGLADEARKYMEDEIQYPEVCLKYYNELLAADRFPPKKKVNSSKYSYFRADLGLLSELGYAETQKEIVEFLLQEYRFRPSLIKELRSIKLG